MTRTRELIVAALLVTLWCGPMVGALHAQTSPAFEVASIKETTQRVTAPSAVSPDRFSRRFITLSQLIVYAYDVTPLQLVSGSDWVSTARFDIEAKADFRPTLDQMRTLVRRLLADRFHLAAHMETRELPRYALVKARSDGRLGPRIRPSAIDCPAIVRSRPLDYRPPTGPPQPGEPPRCAPMSRTGPGTVALILEGTPMSQFVHNVEGQVGRVVVDKTGLPGTYDLEVEIAAVRGAPAPTDQPAAPGDGVSVFTALQEQIGLELEAERGPVDVLVIDHVDHPTDN